jgi:hypothetical protein
VNEYWTTITSDSAEKIVIKRFNPGHSGINVLDSIGKAYDNYILHSCTVTVRGVGATTNSANMKVCIDKQPGNSPATPTTVMQTLPSASLATYQSKVFKLVGAYLMRRNMYVSNAATAGDDEDAFLMVTLTAPATGEMGTWDVFITYDVTFLNPAPLNS